MAAVINAVETPPYFQSEYGMVQKHVINNLPRTNNSVEGFHSALRNCEHSTNLNIWKLIDTLKKEEGLVRAKMTQKLRGDSQRPHARYANINARLHRLVMAYGTTSKMEFLENIAYNLIKF